MFWKKKNKIPEVSNNEAKKKQVFAKVKQFQPGIDIASKDFIVKEYIPALLDYRSWIKSVYIESKIVKFSYFLFCERDITGLGFQKPRQEKQEFRAIIDQSKKLYLQSNWCPPIIWDPYDNLVIDGNHRLLALSELGVKKVLIFEGVKYIGYDQMKREGKIPF